MGWGQPDDVASGVEQYGPPREKFCPYHTRYRLLFRRQRRIIIEEGSWKGGDIFMARGSPAPLLVTERFKQIAEAYQLKNLLLIAAEKDGYDNDRIPSWFINE